METLAAFKDRFIPIGIFTSHAFNRSEDRKRIVAHLSREWASLCRSLEPSVLHPFHYKTSAELNRKLLRRIAQAEIVLVPARPFRQWRRAIIEFELKTARRLEIPIIPVSLEHAARPAAWILELADRPQVEIGYLRSTIESLLPLERLSELKAEKLKEIRTAKLPSHRIPGHA